METSDLVLLIIVLALGMSFPPALAARSLQRFFLSFFYCLTGILIPLLVFVMSAILTPDWKGKCHYGWLSCFHVGKLALMPLLLWACAEFYVRRILKPPYRKHPWVVLGLLMGAIVSAACLILHLVVFSFDAELKLFLLIPLYVSIWYTELYIRTLRATKVSLTVHIITLLSSLPFWVISALLSREYYASLPDEPPKCFVVTATLHGHEALVGPLSKVERRGVSRMVSPQLRTFWQFEEMWATRSPGSHRAFRRVYNRVGPLVASRIRSKFGADAVYLLLKPFEMIALLVIRVHQAVDKRPAGKTRQLS